MNKNIICIECPEGCVLSVDVENRKVLKVNSGKCPKGEKYATSEIENPLRVLTSTVLVEGMSLKMVPVRTDRPIPKGDILKAMEKIKKIRLNKPIHTGDVIVQDFLGTGANLIATREVR